MGKQVRMLLAFSIVAVMCSGVVQAADEDTYEARLELAQRINAVIGPEEGVQDAMSSLLGNLPEEKRQAIGKVVLEKVRELNGVSVMLMTKLFTYEELKYVAAMNDTEMGRGIQKKMRQYQKDLLPHMQEYMKSVMVALQKELQ